MPNPTSNRYKSRFLQPSSCQGRFLGAAAVACSSVGARHAVPEANTGKTRGKKSGAGTLACALTSVDSQRTIATIGPPNPILAVDHSPVAPACPEPRRHPARSLRPARISRGRLFWPHPAAAFTPCLDATIFVSLLLAVTVRSVNHKLDAN